MKKVLSFTVIFLFFCNLTFSQCKLSIKVKGAKPDYFHQINIQNSESSKALLKNDSILQFSLELNAPEYITITLDTNLKWKTKMWMSKEIGDREIVVDYSKITARLIAPNDWDKLTSVFNTYLKQNNQDAADSVALNYILTNRDSYLSLWLFENGFMKNRSGNKIGVAFNYLDPSLKKYPEYLLFSEKILGVKPFGNVATENK